MSEKLVLEAPTGPRACRECVHLLSRSSQPIEGWWWSCAVRPKVGNLWSFPFTNTKCAERTPREEETR
jgi:hypothetical protein